MFNSTCIQNNTGVTFPEFTGERVYMQKFFKRTGLPSNLSRWQDTVDKMLEGVETDNAIYIMIDQGIVGPTAAHRRPGRHIDGYWHDEVKCHSGRGGHMGISSHGGTPGWVFNDSWEHATLDQPEAIILASDVSACDGYIGSWSGKLKAGGDANEIDSSNLTKIRLSAGSSYIGNVGFIHESVPINAVSRRTLVRLNVRNWEPAW